MHGVSFGSVTIVLLALLTAACGGGDGEGAGQDAGPKTDASSGDATPPDASASFTDESEPNNGASATDVNELTVPVGVRGAIGEADDIDVFAVDLIAGELLQWSLQSEGAAHAPHLAIAEASNTAPPTVGESEPGGTLRFHHFALESGRHHFIVRDARNVPAASSEEVGGADNQYLLRSEAPSLQVDTVTVPARASASLAGPYDLALLGFSLAQETDLKIEVFAERASPASDIDSRLSLYYVTGNDWLITNDDPSANQRDSMVTGVLPAGEYRVVIDNLNPAAAILDFEVDFALQ